MSFYCITPKAQNVAYSEPPKIGKRSIYDSMRSPILSHEEEPISTDEPAKKGKGRPRKVDIAKEKAKHASESIKALVAKEPSSKDITEWIKNRLDELNADL
jgi:hypothetical protein